jgi:hypothetical protein
MRVNVYNEELTGRVEPTAKRANGVIFKGIRCYLCFGHEGSEQKIMHTEGDEDTPAVTFFFTDDAGPYWKDRLRKTFTEALNLLDHPEQFAEAIAALDSKMQD